MLSTEWALRISGIIPESIVDGPGFRYVIFTQGCPHHCPGCHNPQTHDFDGGTMADGEKILQEIRENTLLAGVTFSGGEPFCQPAPLAELAREVHAMGKNVFVYTGYTYEKLCEMAKKDKAIAALLAETDTLVDGPYIEAKRNISLKFRGSENQRIIDLKNSTKDNIVLWEG